MDQTLTKISVHAYYNECKNVQLPLQLLAQENLDSRITLQFRTGNKLDIQEKHHLPVQRKGICLPVTLSSLRCQQQTYKKQPHVKY
ncbi:hypothetical protein DPMN_000393 [Dreissena polymorpha]|uniref:Uncharacterized protein n=1 Tax=Dreissena polymorpha TaxID=45954 RepID=A0A9D4MHA0_DREPO|nr:hypothetical protein DPMN_000393 [Dreissena polymorpha]